MGFDWNAVPEDQRPAIGDTFTVLGDAESPPMPIVPALNADVPTDEELQQDAPVEFPSDSIRDRLNMVEKRIAAIEELLTRLVDSSNVTGQNVAMLCQNTAVAFQAINEMGQRLNGGGGLGALFGMMGSKGGEQ